MTGMCKQVVTSGRRGVVHRDHNPGNKVWLPPTDVWTNDLGVVVATGVAVQPERLTAKRSYRGAAGTPA